MPYDHQAIEKKWQNHWEETGLFYAKNDSPKEKFYCLIEFPYPSGAGLHIGHPRSNTALDVIAHKKRMEGKNVFYPIGWDAFGLPTENYAIKTKRKPQDVTAENIATFKRQLKALGFSFDWSREVNTTDPAYYKWTQWQFLQFFKAGLAYKAKMPVNWCLSCKISLANEEVVNGRCERCGGAIEKRDKEQWMIAITKYADRLLSDLDTVDYLPKIKKQQQEWIGRSEGINIRYPVEGTDIEVEIFTTRPDTNFGATFIAVAPDSKFVREHIEAFPERVEVERYVRETADTSDIDRGAEGRKKTGAFTGLYATNPLTGRRMPIWVADFTLGNVGTGALVGVPGHDMRDFEFATAFGIDVMRVVIGLDGDASPITRPEQVQEEAGTMINSGFLDGMDIHAATQAMMDHMEKEGWGTRTVTYKLRDWVFSRQRYWGEPIPLVHCEDGCSPENGGWVAIRDEDLPVVLPEVEHYEPTDSGESPLAAIEDWVKTTCPFCGGPARRETDTMPNWAGSSWYFLRYADPHNDQAFASKEALAQWMPVDWYNGGMEHTTLHLLYSRFWNKFLYDQGLVPTSEPYAKRTSHGLILAEDGTKMSKSKGNVVNPDSLVAEYGADTVRLYLMFMGPFGEPVPWNTNGVVGIRRFLEKVWTVAERVKIEASTPPSPPSGRGGDSLTRQLHKAIKKVSDDIDALKMNTAVSQLMMLANAMQEASLVSRETLATFVQLLAPFAPHAAEELWQGLGHTESVFLSSWPMHNPEFAKDEVVEVAIQVNGKLRGTMRVMPDLPHDQARDLALAEENVAKHMEGKTVAKVVYVPGRLINFVVR